MFAYERPMDDTLVLMAGVPAGWIDAGGIGIAGLNTAYGPLTYSFKIVGSKRVLEIAAMRLPPGGIAISWPEKPGGTQTITSGAARWTGDELRVAKLPFSVEFQQQ
jgi:hypothetical protein